MQHLAVGHDHVKRSVTFREIRTSREADEPRQDLWLVPTGIVFRWNKFDLEVA